MDAAIAGEEQTGGEEMRSTRGSERGLHNGRQGSLMIRAVGATTSMTNDRCMQRRKKDRCAKI